MQTRETIIRIVLVALLLYSLLSFVSVRREATLAEERNEELRTELAALENKNKELRLAVESAGNDEEIMRLARERLGLVMPGEIVFCFDYDQNR